MKNRWLPLGIGLVLTVVNLVLFALMIQLWVAGPQNFGQPVEIQALVEPTPTPTYPDLCPGVIYYDGNVTRQIITADQNGRDGRAGILDWTYDPDLPEGDFEVLTTAGGRDPRDGCPYEVVVVKGSNFAYGLKRDHEGLKGHYSVIRIGLLGVPTHILDVSFSDDGIILRYETEGDGEINESIEFNGNFPVG